MYLSFFLYTMHFSFLSSFILLPQYCSQVILSEYFEGQVQDPTFKINSLNLKTLFTLLVTHSDPCQQARPPSPSCCEYWLPAVHSRPPVWRIALYSMTSNSFGKLLTTTPQGASRQLLSDRGVQAFTIASGWNNSGGLSKGSSCSQTPADISQFSSFLSPILFLLFSFLRALPGYILVRPSSSFRLHFQGTGSKIHCLNVFCSPLPSCLVQDPMSIRPSENVH